MSDTNQRANAARFIFCQQCSGMLTMADDEAGRCTQCDERLPPLRALLTKIATAHTYDPGETDLDDKQPVTLAIDLGDVRLARRLLQ